MHSQPLLAFVALAASVVAQNTTTYSDILSFGSPYGAASTEPTNDTQRARFAEANLNPNVTRSFQFTPFYLDGVFNSGSNAIDESNVWTLRINVTDFAVPNATPEYSTEPGYVDPHITNTVFELDWDGDDSFRSALNGSTQPFCVAMTTASFLPNVTNLFTEDNDSGDCEPVLGAECLNAILASSSGLDSCSYDIWETLPECASTIGASRSYAEYGLSRISSDINSNRTANNASYADAGYEAIANGTDGQYGFFSHSTDAYNATNTTIFDEESSRLYVMLVSVSPYQGQFGLWSQNALCMRASAARLDEGSQDSSSSEEGEGDEGNASEDENENAASALMTASRTGSVLAVAGMIGLFAVL